LDTLLPSFSLSVCITGHRSIPEGEHNRICAQLDELFKEIGRTAETITLHGRSAGFFKDEPILRLVSCLSEGSDRIAARLALANKFKLQAVLPFPVESPAHALDLHGEAKEESLLELRRLCSLAENTLQLSPDVPAWLQDKDLWSDNEEATAFRQNAYLKASCEMLHFGDLLIAIWNGKSQPWQGGTFDTVLRAIRGGLPVFVINSLKDSPIKILTREEDLFSDNISAKSVSNIIQERYSLGNKDLVSDFLRVREALSSLDNKQPPFLARSWNFFQTLLTRRDLKKLPTGPYREEQQEIFKKFDEAANYCAAMHRSSFLGLALLTVLSIVFAATAAVWPSGETWLGAITVLSIAEIVTLAGAIVNVIQARRRNWQKKLTTFRFVAEVVRLNIFASKIGLSCPYRFSGTSLYADDDSKWCIYLLRNCIRSMGFSSFNMADKAEIASLREEIGQYLVLSQYYYHIRNQARCQIMARAIERLASILFYISLLVVLLRIGSTFTVKLPLLDAFLTFVSAIGPALGSASQGIAQTAELKRLSIRSAHIAKILQTYVPVFEKSISGEDIQKNTEDILKLMVLDVKDWKEQYSMPSLSLS